ncbi:MAG TPA: prolyl oligopeptidase family serine peptidase [Blastocatellia bacterium]|nr:prolyl oligopeptidase family serine peptidase [Blastocatellia bacterium]
MKKTLAGILLVDRVAISCAICRTICWTICCAICCTEATGQQIPFLSELLSRNEDFVRLYSEKRRAGANLTAIEPARKRAEDAFRRGNIPGILEALSEGQALLAGKKWDERQKFIASLTLEVDRLVVEPNQVLQVSLTRMFPAAEKAFASPPTVTFTIVSSEGASKPAESQPAPTLTQPLIIADRLAIGETSSTASRKLLLLDGSYQVVAVIEAGGQTVGEIRRSIYAVADFSDSVSRISRTIATIKGSSDARVQAVVPRLSTAEFQLERLAQMNKSRGESELNPNQEIDRIEGVLTALARGRNPLARERGEVERAYRAADNKLVPYRVYVPKSYDASSPRPLVVLLHGDLGDERSYFSGLFDPSVIKGEADRRGWILVAVNGRGRLSSYTGAAQNDVFDVIEAVSREYKIDASRIYLTGHSTGGLGTWLVAGSKPDQFAAIAAISAGALPAGDPLNSLLAKLKGVPILVAHGARDGITPIQLSKTMVAAAEKAGINVSFLEVPDGDHLSVVGSTFPAVLNFFEKNAKSR